MGDRQFNTRFDVPYLMKNHSKGMFSLDIETPDPLGRTRKKDIATGILDNTFASMFDKPSTGEKFVTDLDSGGRRENDISYLVFKPDEKLTNLS